LRSRTRVTTATLVVALTLGVMAFATHPPVSAAECAAYVTAPANLHDRFRAAPEGAVICLSGTFRITSSLVPRDGQRIVGPAVVENGSGVDDGFDLSRTEGVVVEGLEIRNFLRRGVKCGLGTQVLGSVIHHNRQNAVGCSLRNRSASGVLVAENQIYNNGVGNLEGNTAGGMKFVRSGKPGDVPGSAVTVRDNLIWANLGNGIWFDINSAGDLISGNEIWGNTRNGIRYEISAGPAVIRGNFVHDNRWYGIWSTSSAKVKVLANTSINNGRKDITIMSDERARLTFPALGGNHDGYKIVDIDVHDNVVTKQLSGCSLKNVSC
jgi:hypothetical protein